MQLVPQADLPAALATWSAGQTLRLATHTQLRPSHMLFSLQRKPPPSLMRRLAISVRGSVVHVPYVHCVSLHTLFFLQHKVKSVFFLLKMRICHGRAVYNSRSQSAKFACKCQHAHPTRSTFLIPLSQNIQVRFIFSTCVLVIFLSTWHFFVAATCMLLLLIFSFSDIHNKKLIIRRLFTFHGSIIHSRIWALHIFTVCHAALPWLSFFS